MAYNNALFATLAATLIVYLKALFAFSWLGWTKILASARAEEDTYQAKPRSDAKGKKRAAALDRWRRISQNDLENIPLGLIAMWAAMWSIHDAEAGVRTAHIAMVYAFAAARVVHTFAYAFKLSLLRSLAWFTNVLATIGLLGNALVAASA